MYAAARCKVPGRHDSRAVADRELLSLDYPRALTARPGSSAASERGKRHPPSRHSEKRAMFTQMRAETRAVASLPFAFRFAAY